MKHKWKPLGIVHDSPPLYHIPESHGAVSHVAQFLRRVAIVLSSSELSFPLLVDALIVHHEEDYVNNAHAYEYDLQGVAKPIIRRVLGAVEVGRHCSSKIATADVHCLNSY